MNSAQQPAFCPACMSPGTAYVEMDRNGSPYLKCGLCRVTIFMPTELSTTYLKGSDETIRGLLNRTGRSLAEVRAEIHAAPGHRKTEAG